MKPPKKKPSKVTNEFLVAAYVMIANEITRDEKWPWALPDPHDLAVKAHKKIQNRLIWNFIPWYLSFNQR